MRHVYNLTDLRNWSANTAAEALPIRLAVLGDPVAHSASPAMQNAALAAVDLAIRYARLHIHADELPEALGLLAPSGFIGVNITLPHKTEALSAVDFLDQSASELGAVNTIRVEADGRLRGFNTDGPGFARAVRQDLGLELSGASVLILGAGGGAGRALAAQCALAGCARLTLVNRTLDKVQLLADDLRQRTGGNVHAVAWEQASFAAALTDVDLVVNTSSLGLRDEDDSPLPATLLPAGTRVFDTVYRRDGTPTPLVQAARKANVPAVGGLSLLLHQGALAFEIWFNQPAPMAAMRQALKSP